ncbi:DUF5677 domain-containing protein [Enterococcus faecium]|uniref:DUF5677 domain-containing protein n=2 Tax=Enterococcus TaxID=1350 RepID=UPI001883CA79|nr:DUF5677 domain-containing protein [Enterococcus faecium]MBE9890740.1 hypothetical protein [Enterococcus faecium]MCV3186084.1 DUF5677 domain-containing protein [Enterococcus faecium]UQQ77174.1 DUF5677 domain-containing protein [Enterococcus faecium]
MKKGIINAAEGIMKRSIEIKGDSQEIESEDLVIISLQNSLVEKAKDINYLLDKKRIQSINIILRSMLEQYVSLIYILKDQTKLKAKLYIYSFKIQRIEKLIDTMNFMENMDEYDISENDNIRKIILEKIQRDDPKLNSIEDYISKLKESYDDVQPYKPNKKDKFYYEKWYNINGKIRGMRNLMKEINIADADYEFFYSLASMDVHGISAFGNVKASKNELVLESSLDIKLLESLMTSYLISSAKAITNYYSVNNDSKIKGYMKQFEINFKYQSVNK